MNNQIMLPLKDLSQDELLNRTLLFVEEERKFQLALIECLREVERRSLHLQMGFSSLWEFAVRYLKLSEGAAQRRISAMRLSSEVPEAKSALESGALSLSNASRIHSFFRNEKKGGTHRTAEQKGELIRDLLKPSLLNGNSSGAKQNTTQNSTQSSSSESSHTVRDEKKIGAGISQRECELKLAELAPHVSLTLEKVRPLGNGKTELKIIVDESTMKQLEELKGLLAHRLPKTTYSEVVATVIEDALKRANRKVAGKSSINAKQDEPTTILERKGSECPAPEDNKTQRKCTISTAVLKSEVKHIDPRVIGIPASIIREPISAQVRQAVWRRAGGKCEFVATVGPQAGQPCQSAFRLQIDHRQSIASGGSNHINNLNLLCASHHAHKTKSEFPEFKLKRSSR